MTIAAHQTTRYCFELTAFLCFDVEARDKEEARACAAAFAREAHEYARLTQVEWPLMISEVSLAFEDIPELVDVPDDDPRGTEAGEGPERGVDLPEVTNDDS